jgi:hypothetical protein
MTVTGASITGWMFFIPVCLLRPRVATAAVPRYKMFAYGIGRDADADVVGVGHSARGWFNCPLFELLRARLCLDLALCDASTDYCCHASQRSPYGGNDRRYGGNDRQRQQHLDTSSLQRSIVACLGLSRAR